MYYICVQFAFFCTIIKSKVPWWRYPRRSTTSARPATPAPIRCVEGVTRMKYMSGRKKSNLKKILNLSGEDPNFFHRIRLSDKNQESALIFVVF